MPARSTWWTRGQVLAWIMTRRLAAVAECRKDAPGAVVDANALLWSIDDTLRRGNAARASRQLPTLPAALALLEAAETDGLQANAGQYKSEEVRRRWPSLYGRATKRGAKKRGGVAPKDWDEQIIRKLMVRFVTERRNATRNELREWVGGVSFSDPERWTAYIRRAMSAAIIDILLRRYRDPSFSRNQGANSLANVWSWRADGRIPPPSSTA